MKGFLFKRCCWEKKSVQVLLKVFLLSSLSLQPRAFVFGVKLSPPLLPLSFTLFFPRVVVVVLS